MAKRYVEGCEETLDFEGFCLCVRVYVRERESVCVCV